MIERGAGTLLNARRDVRSAGSICTKMLRNCDA